MGNVISANQFDFGPAVFAPGGALERGLNIGEQFRQQQQERLQQEFLEGGGLQDPAALQNAGEISLSFQRDVANQLGLLDKRTGQVNQARLTEAADFAFKIQDLPIEQQNIAINKRIETLESQGRDATQTRELLALPVEQRAAGLEGVQLAALPNETRLEFITGRFNRDRIKSFAPRANAEGGLSVPQVAADGTVSFVAVPGSVAETAVTKGARVAEEKKALEEVKTTETERREVKKLTAKRKQSFVDSGLEAADSLANIRRSIELLDNVKTGGLDAALLRGKQLLGVESADEAELSAGLGKAILSQLRPIFGAAFTEAEGARLERIEAGFGKLTEGNKRLLKQLMKIVNRSAKRGLASAEDLGDSFTANEIREALGSNISLDQSSQDEGVVMEDANGNKARVFKDGRIEEL